MSMMIVVIRPVDDIEQVDLARDGEHEDFVILTDESQRLLDFECR